MKVIWLIERKNYETTEDGKKIQLPAYSEDIKIYSKKEDAKKCFEIYKKSFEENERLIEVEEFPHEYFAGKTMLTGMILTYTLRPVKLRENWLE